MKVGGVVWLRGFPWRRCGFSGRKAGRNPFCEPGPTPPQKAFH